MDDEDRCKLRQNRVAIVTDLEPKDVLDHLQEDGILTENDCEHICNEKTRKERCHALLSLLPTRGPNAYGAFTHALKRSQYTQLDTILNRTSDETSPHLKHHREKMTCVEGPQQANRGQGIMVRAEITGRQNPENPFSVSFDKECPSSQVFQQNYTAILQNVDPVDLLDLHYQEELLDDDQCERIRAGVTRYDRCKIFLKELSHHQPVISLPILQRSLEKKYGFLSRKLQEAVRAESDAQTRGETKPKFEQMNVVCDISRKAQNKQCSTESVTHYRKSRMARKTSTCNERHIMLSRTLAKPDAGANDQNAVVRQQHRDQCSEDVPDSGIVLSRQHAEICPDHPTVLKNPGSMKPMGLPNKRLVVAFNFLSTLINQGFYDKFETFSNNIRRRFYNDPDMTCVLEYLHASRDLYNTNFDEAKKHIDSAFELVPKTSNPKYFTVELFTAKTRMYITQKKLEKLQTTLDDAKMIIETDPRGCTGRAAGWLYMNDARNKTAQISMLNFRNPKTIDVYERLHVEAQASFQKALANFQQDGGKDGPFGFGYALCRLAILLLRCGDNGLTMNVLHPHEDDVVKAGGYLTQLENSDIHIPKILNVHYLLAKCDYQFRRKNTIRALEHAEAAYELATEIAMFEFTEHARNREVFLRSKTPLILEDISEEEAATVLFGSSSEESADADN